MTQPLFAILLLNDPDNDHYLWDAGGSNYSERPSLAKLYDATTAYHRRLLKADAYGEDRVFAVTRETAEAAQVAWQQYIAVIKSGALPPHATKETQ